MHRTGDRIGHKPRVSVPPRQLIRMDDLRLGTAIRPRSSSSRLAAGGPGASRAGRLSQPTISRIERGHVGSLSVACLREVGAELEIRVDLVPRWRGGDLDRLLNRAHSGLHESVARSFRDALPAWSLAPEVSFAFYGERGVVDIVGWHPGRRSLLVIELEDGDRRPERAPRHPRPKASTGAADRRGARLGSSIDLDVVDHPGHPNEPPPGRGPCGDACGRAAP